MKPNFLQKHSSSILAIVGAGGVIFTAVSAVKATPKALTLIDEAKKKKGEELTTVEVVQETWKCYIPTAVSGVLTIACIVGANILNKKHQASLTAAYALVNNRYHEYRDKVKDIYGEEADERIEREIMQAKETDLYAPACIGPATSLNAGEYGDKVMFYDSFAERYFESTLVQVIEAEYHLNRNFILGGVVSLNDFYELLGLEPVEYGNDIGWSSFDEIYWIDFDNRKVQLEDGLECIIVSSLFDPTPEAMNDL